MDGMVLGLFLASAFLGGLTTGIAGFAMGLVVSGIWLHILTPVQTAVLIVAYGIVMQSYGIWKLRHALDWRQVVPFIIGGAVGVPIGAMVLTYINPAYFRTGVGVLLVLYSIYGSGAAGAQADAGRIFRRRRHWISQWAARRTDRPRGRRRDHLVPIARLAEGHSAYGFSAGHHHDVCHDRDFVWRERHGDCRYRVSCFFTACRQSSPVYGLASNFTENSTMPSFAR